MRKGLVAVVACLVMAGAAGTAVVLQDRDAAVAPVTGTPVPFPTRTSLLGDAPDGVLPTAAGLQRALATALAAHGLGARVSLSVVDVVTGKALLEVDADREVTPASTAKIATAAAVLATLPRDRRITTRAVQGSAAGDVVLVGAGDPTLSTARLKALAARVRAAHSGAVRRVVVDDALFTGPRLGPSWKPSYVRTGNVAPVSALSVDGGRKTLREGAPRSADPALAAGKRFAALLGARTVVRGVAPAGARLLGQSASATVTDLVEQMLTHSDNDLAEALGRHVALARKQPASFAGEAAAIHGALRDLGADVALADASGLSPEDRVSPAAITAVLRKAATDERFGPMLSGLPIAGFDGTLAERFRSGPFRAAAGEVRAKTGTLDGVSALAGLVRTRGGRLLAFDLTADGVRLGATVAAQKALDLVATELAACGCAG